MSADAVDPLPAEDPTPADLFALVELLAGKVENLAERVAALEDDSPRATMPFDEWVPWLLDTFALTDKLARWAAVPAVGLELEALHAAWCDAFKSDGSPRSGTRATSWHETFDRSRMRMVEYLADQRRREGSIR